ncbi:12567_t:CDS:1, partial [Ambispora gerdemannii]
NFCSNYAGKSSVTTYLEETWMPWKKRFVKTWMNTFLHLGTTVTSHIEGAHSTLKAYLQVSTEDLHRVHTSISLMITNQKKEIDATVASEHIHLPVFVLSNPLYTNIKGKVSIFALKKIYEQSQKAKRSIAQVLLPSCTGSFSKTMGLSCAHYIQHLEENQSLTLDDIHMHWWIQDHSSVSQAGKNDFCHEDTLQPLLQDLQERYQE